MESKPTPEQTPERIAEQLREWQTVKPPHGVVVEVQNEDGIHRARAIHGSDGVLPHWESEDRDTLWAAWAFRKWRCL